MNIVYFISGMIFGLAIATLFSILFIENIIKEFAAKTAQNILANIIEKSNTNTTKSDSYTTAQLYEKFINERGNN